MSVYSLSLTGWFEVITLIGEPAEGKESNPGRLTRRHNIQSGYHGRNVLHDIITSNQGTMAGTSYTTS